MSPQESQVQDRAKQCQLEPNRRRLLVLTMGGLVHAAWPGAAAAQQSGRGEAKRPAARPPEVAPGIIVGHDPGRLPPAVADMRSAILAAVESGEIDELRYAIDLNELKPDFGMPAGGDVIAHLKTISGDGAGREVLAILGRLLEASYAAVPGGRDIENNRIYVWPHFAEVGVQRLKPAEEVALYRLITPAEAAAMREAGRWRWWRLAIGADGVWHSFRMAA